MSKNQEKPLDNQNSTIISSKTKTKKRKKKLRKWMKKHKALSIILAILLAVLIAFGGLFINSRLNSGKTTYSFIRTTTLAKGSLDDSISATGTVKSAETSNVTTSQNLAVEKVYVSVGDKVEKGDTICTLDSTDIIDQIEKEQENIAKTKKSAQSSYDSANESYNKAVAEYNEYLPTYNNALADKNSALSPFSTAKTSVSSYQTAYNSAKTAYNKAGAAFVTAKSNFEAVAASYKKGSASASKLAWAAENYLQAIQNYYGGCAVGNYDISDSTSTQSGSSQGAQGATASATSNSASVTQTAQNLCDKVVAQVKTLCGRNVSYSAGANAIYKLSQKASALRTAKTQSNYVNLESDYLSAKSAFDSAKQTISQYKEALAQAKSQLSQAEEQLENASTSDELSQLETQLEQCTLTANQDGTVTALNATVGSASSGMDALATIQNLDKLKVSITIEEADINNAKLNMSCYITSDATEDTLNGTLTQIDPTAGETGSFGAEVTVDSKSNGLLIGMNASVEIIVSSTEDVFQVPIDAIGNDDDGKGDYIYRSTGGEGTDMTFEKVYITAGEKNDYYIEVESDSLSQGDVIRSSSDLSEGVETMETDSSSGFNLSALFGGAGKQNMGNRGSMPSGGNIPSFGSGNSSSGGNMPSGGGTPQANGGQ